jgi:hypothetical protein
MIDEYTQVLDDAAFEITIGGTDIAASMLRKLRLDFPATYVMPWLDFMIEDPTAPRWDNLREEVLAAAGALLGHLTQADVARKAQAKVAAQRPRGSKWDAFRTTLADDLEEIVATEGGGADILAAELRELWKTRGFTEIPPRSTVIRWIQKT